MKLEIDVPIEAATWRGRPISRAPHDDDDGGGLERGLGGAALVESAAVGDGHNLGGALVLTRLEGPFLTTRRDFVTKQWKVSACKMDEIIAAIKVAACLRPRDTAIDGCSQRNHRLAPLSAMHTPLDDVRKPPLRDIRM